MEPKGREPSTTRVMSAATPCAHEDQIRAGIAPQSRGCAACVASGERWVHLRLCLSCGHVGCCDASTHNHAAAHFRATGHPLVASLEPNETWRWCYLDETFLDADGV